MVPRGRIHLDITGQSVVHEHMLKLVTPALAAAFNWASARGGFPFKGLSCCHQRIVY